MAKVSSWMSKAWTFFDDRETGTFEKIPDRCFNVPSVKDIPPGKNTLTKMLWQYTHGSPGERARLLVYLFHRWPGALGPLRAEVRKQQLQARKSNQKVNRTLPRASQEARGGELSDSAELCRELVHTRKVSRKVGVAAKRKPKLVAKKCPHSDRTSDSTAGGPSRVPEVVI